MTVSEHDEVALGHLVAFLKSKTRQHLSSRFFVHSCPLKSTGVHSCHIPKRPPAKASKTHAIMAPWGKSVYSHSDVAQASEPAVSPTSQSANRAQPECPDHRIVTPRSTLREPEFLGNSIPALRTSCLPYPSGFNHQKSAHAPIFKRFRPRCTKYLRQIKIGVRRFSVVALPVDSCHLCSFVVAPKNRNFPIPILERAHHEHL